MSKPPEVPEVRGRHVYLHVPKGYGSRTLGYAIDRALDSGDLNGEQRLSLVLLKIQLKAHWTNTKGKKS